MLAAALALLSLPVLVAVAEAVSFVSRNRNNGTLVSSGSERRYFLYVPESYDLTRPSALVISMHGAAGWPVQQMELSRWNELAESEGFIVVYPSGARAMGFSSVWRVQEGDGLKRDAQFISDLIDRLERDYNIDSTRIYANGLSNGGGMSFVLSCTLSDRIAAIGTVAAAQTLPWSWCTDSGPVPVISFHGTADPIVPYEGGTTWVGPTVFPAVEDWTASWAERNRCRPEPSVSSVAPDVRRLEYPHCAGNASVALYTIDGGGHTWPGGGPLPTWLVGPNTDSVDATRIMWDFFERHPLRRRTP